MSNGFNLNIYNYNLSELENLLSLRSPYTDADINNNLCNLREKLLKDTSKSHHDKKAIQQFLDNVKLRLVKDNFAVSSRSGYSNINSTDELMLVPDVSVLNSHNYKRREFIPTFPNKPATENLNPIQKRIIKKTLNIDTRFRDNYFSTKASDLYITLPAQIKNATKMRLTGLELPENSIYAITKENNTFWVRDGESEIKISEGNYTIGEMVDELNEKYNTDNSLNFVWEKGASHIRMDISEGMSVTFSKESNSPPQLGLGWTLGFIYNKYDVSRKYTAEAAYDRLGPKYLYLAIDDFNNNVNNYFTGAFNNSVLNKNILARIPRYFNDQELLSLPAPNDNEHCRSYFGPINIQKLRVQLLDEYGRPVSLHNRDYSFSLEFDCIYN